LIREAEELILDQEELICAQGKLRRFVLYTPVSAHLHCELLNFEL
jgi:hypothetical protein